MREYLIAVYIVGVENNSGQNDPWYSRACLAGIYLRRWYQIDDPFAWTCNPDIKFENRRRAFRYMSDLNNKYFERTSTL